jgi:3-hydroxybutyryl-CoA dehydratase
MIISKTIVGSMIEDFAKISGDFNPIHINNEYAKTTKFKNRICHGMFLGSLISQYISKEFPMSIYLSQSLFFHKPCYINDKIKISGKILDSSENKITIRTTITRNEDIIVDGIAKIVIKKS